MEYIAFDAHKHYTLASVVRPDGQLVREERIEHARGSLREFLERCERGSPVAVETIGNWYWIVDEIEAADRKSTRLNSSHTVISYAVFCLKKKKKKQKK